MRALLLALAVLAGLYTHGQAVEGDPAIFTKGSSASDRKTYYTKESLSVWSYDGSGNFGFKPQTDFVLSGGTYSNPSFITSLPWSKITSTPTTIGGYGITDLQSVGNAYWDLLGAAAGAEANANSYTDARLNLPSLTDGPAEYGPSGAALITNAGENGWRWSSPLGSMAFLNSWTLQQAITAGGTVTSGAVIFDSGTGIVIDYGASFGLRSQTGGAGVVHRGPSNSTIAKTVDWRDLSGTGALLSDIPTSLPPNGAAGGDLTGTYPNPVLATVNSNVGTFGSATAAPSITVNGKGLITGVTTNTITPAVGSITGLGTGVGTWLATPSSANLRAALTDEVGTGAAYFVGGALGTPASATLTNATGLPTSGLTQSGAATGDIMRWNGSAWAPSDIGSRVSIPTYSAGNQSNSSNTTMANATGSQLVLPSAGVWDVSYAVLYDAAATATGAHFSVNYSGTAALGGIVNYTAAAADGMTSNIGANDNGLAVLSSRVASGNSAIVFVKVVASTSGTLQLSWKSEVNSSAITITSISVGEAVKIAN